MRRVVRAVSSFLIQLFAALLKTVVTTLVVGLVLVTLMHYMGIPVPSAADMLRGVERLADVLS
jgi:antibiotic biosynthesis monooxygenase (ABM) superfamily enzyme